MENKVKSRDKLKSGAEKIIGRKVQEKQKKSKKAIMRFADADDSKFIISVRATSPSD